MWAVVAQPVLERPMNPMRIGAMMSTLFTLFADYLKEKSAKKEFLEYEFQWTVRVGEECSFVVQFFGSFLHMHLRMGRMI
jgi:hypothetical protein